MDNKTVEQAEAYARWCRRVLTTEATIVRMKTMAREQGPLWSKKQIVYHKKRLANTLRAKPPKP